MRSLEQSTVYSDSKGIQKVVRIYKEILSDTSTVYQVSLRIVDFCDNSESFLNIDCTDFDSADKLTDLICNKTVDFN